MPPGRPDLPRLILERSESVATVAWRSVDQSPTAKQSPPHRGRRAGWSRTHLI